MSLTCLSCNNANKILRGFPDGKAVTEQLIYDLVAAAALVGNHWRTGLYGGHCNSLCGVATQCSVSVHTCL